MGVAFRQIAYIRLRSLCPSLRWPDEPDAVRKVVRVALVRCRGEPAIIAPGEKVFGALLAIAGAVSVMTGHWATTDDMIADLIAGGLVLAVGIVVLLMWSFQR
jgi:hypothetical protein